jgi:hypothetical protein
MAELNTIYYNDPNRQLIVNNVTNEFVVSGYRLVVDGTLNRDLSLVATPLEPTSPGKKGNLAFDKNYVYYCLADNSWSRSALATWESVKPEAISSKKVSSFASKIPQPSNWWNFTTNIDATYGDYQFSPIGADVAATFSSGGAYLPGATGSNTNQGGFLNFSSNLVEPTTLNESFSISFETRRLNKNSAWQNQFLLGSIYGKLGFGFEYNLSGQGLNSIIYSGGNFLTFKFQVPGAGPTYQRVQSKTAITDTGYHQIVGVNDSYSKAILLYIDGALQGSGNYTGPAGFYNNPSFKGFGIGAAPFGSFNTPVNNTAFSTPTVIRYLGFWKNYALTSGQVSSLYNTGSFNRFPFN